MTAEETLLIKRFQELADRADRRGIYTFTDFLGLNGQSVLDSILKSLPAPCVLFGGMEGCERAVARFGDPDSFHYETPFPIACVRILPRDTRFSEPPTHRDYLGALMNLGVDRDTLGDILLVGEGAYLFLLESVADFVIHSLATVRRSTVRCTLSAPPEGAGALALTPLTVKVTSLRLDSLIARAYSLSREESAELFQRGRVFLNGAPCEKDSIAPKAGDLVSVRGFGRFAFCGEDGLTKKGKINAKLQLYQGR